MALKKIKHPVKQTSAYKKPVRGELSFPFVVSLSNHKRLFCAPNYELPAPYFLPVQPFDRLRMKGWNSSNYSILQSITSYDIRLVQNRFLFGQHLKFRFEFIIHNATAKTSEMPLYQPFMALIRLLSMC
jgi:hypothetical protein